MKRTLALITALVMIFALCAVSASADKAEEPVVLRLNMSDAPGGNKGQTIEKLKAEIEEGTEGRVVVEVYYNSELGTPQENIEAISLGANMVEGVSPAGCCEYGCYDLMALDLMKMLKSPEECNILNESDLFKEMCAQLEEESDFKVLAVNWPNQPRNILSKKPINSVEDLKGLIIRVPGAHYISFFSRLGCACVTMSTAETYTALQQGTADACEYSLDNLYGSSFYEVAKYCYLTEHTYAPCMWVMNANIFNSLSEEDQAVILKAFYEGGKYFSELNDATLAEYRAKLEENGVTFVTPSEADLAVMDAAAAESVEDFPKFSEGIIDRIDEALGR